MPLAYWCILIAAVMPMILVGYAKSSSRDNNAPRDSAEQLAGSKRRAYAAHQNCFESFPFFAVAVIAALMFGATTATVNILAVIFILARVVYAFLYITDRPSMRSAVYGIGFLVNIAIFALPAFR